jgi:hypothetical protein
VVSATGWRRRPGARRQEFGRVPATILRVELDLLLGWHYQAGQLLGRLLHPSFMPEGFLTDPLFTEEFLPWLLDLHARNATHNRNAVLKLAMIGERPEIHSPSAKARPGFDGQARARGSAIPRSTC